jgi:hypothetical protein
MGAWEKRPGLETDHSPSSAEVRMVELYLYSPILFIAA